MEEQNIDSRDLYRYLPLQVTLEEDGLKYKRTKSDNKSHQQLHQTVYLKNFHLIWIEAALRTN